VISIVIPLRDEAGNVPSLLEELEHARDPAADVEILCVDDGSQDTTGDVLRELVPRFPRLRVIEHERGYGQSAAISTGVRAARGDWIVTMDGDGQNDPADIPRLLDFLNTPGPPPAMVVGWRRNRQDPWAKRIASRVANGIYRFFLRDPTPDVGCGLKLFRRETFLALPSFAHMHRFLPALVRSRGGRVQSVEVRHRARRTGRSKYGVADRLVVGIIDILGVKWLQKRSNVVLWKETTGLPVREPSPTAVDPASAGGQEIEGGKKTRSLYTLLAFAFALFLIFVRLGDLPLMDPDEGRNAEVAREMAVSDRWLVPTYNGMPYLDKPALYFKLVALSFDALGTNETAARIPSALFAAALLVLIYGFCRREYGSSTAALAVAIVAAMPLFLAFARLVIFDMALAFFTSLTILAGFRAEERSGWQRLAAYSIGAASAGVATLMKGVVGFLVPTLVLLVLAFAEPRRSVWRRIFHPLPLAAFLLLVVPWFVGLSIRRPDFPYYGLFIETFQRFTEPTFLRNGPFYYYVPVLAAVSFPWSIPLCGAVTLGWRERSRWKRADLLFVVWAATVLVFFSISQSKLPGYILTAVVALGVLLARLFVQALRDPAGAAGRVVFRSAIALGVVGCALSTWLAVEARSPGSTTAALQILGSDYDAARTLFRPLLYVLPAIAGVAIVGWFARKIPLVLGAFFILPVSLLTVYFGSLEEYARDVSSMPLAEEVRSIAPGATVVCFRSYPTGLAFYLERPLFLLTDDGRDTTSNYIPFYLSRKKRWPPEVIPVSRMRRWLRARRQPLFLLATERRSAALDTLAAAEGGTVRDLVDGWRGLYLPAPPVRN
jgi:4-amino-4-deoxy-L-arabinose transferase-like glycosyltransferase